MESKTTKTPTAEMAWPKMPLMSHNSGLYYRWHHAINNHSSAMMKQKKEWPRWIYEAKHAAEETPRLALLFERERTGKLPKLLRRCSFSKSENVSDNHLTCCLGTECRECEHLAAITNHPELSDEERDWIKAWTCVGHILSEGGDAAGEGFILTTDDRMYWDGVYKSMSSHETTDQKPKRP